MTILNHYLSFPVMISLLVHSFLEVLIEDDAKILPATVITNDTKVPKSPGEVAKKKLVALNLRFGKSRGHPRQLTVKRRRMLSRLDIYLTIFPVHSVGVLPFQPCWVLVRKSNCLVLV